MTVQRSLAARLLTGIILAIAGTSFAFILLFQWIVQSHSRLLVEDGLVGQAEEVVDGLSITNEGAWKVKMHEPMQTGYDAFYSNLKYRVLDESGRTRVSSEASTDLLMPFEASDTTRIMHREQDEWPLSVATVPFMHEGRRIYVQAARSDRFAELAMEAIAPAVVQTAGAVGLLAATILGLAVWAVTRRALAPLRDLSDEARQIRPGNLSARLSTGRLPAEIAPLVEAFNETLSRVESGHRAQQRFLANAAHELKTPLALLRAELEMNGKSVGHDCLRDIDVMGRLIQQLLQLTEATESISYRFGPVHAMQVALEVERFLAPLREPGRVRIIFAGDAPSEVIADEGAFFILLKNLVENAVRYSPAGAGVTIRFSAGGLDVEDEGPGISPEHLPHVFERFWRSPERKGDGAGLGLAIVQEIARNHGWTIVAMNRPEGGALFRLSWLIDSDRPG